MIIPAFVASGSPNFILANELFAVKKLIPTSAEFSSTNSFASDAAVTEPALSRCTCNRPSGESVPTPIAPALVMRSLSAFVLLCSVTNAKSLVAEPFLRATILAIDWLDPPVSKTNCEKVSVDPLSFLSVIDAVSVL